jgi:hypothetical protein
MAATAMAGAGAGQKQSLGFVYDPKGQEAVFDFVAKETDPNKLNKELVARGLPYHTLVKTQEGTRVVIYDPSGRDGLEAADKASEEIGNVELNVRRGKGEFIGDEANRALGIEIQWKRGLNFLHQKGDAGGVRSQKAKTGPQGQALVGAGGDAVPGGASAQGAIPGAGGEPGQGSGGRPRGAASVGRSEYGSEKAFAQAGLLYTPSELATRAKEFAGSKDWYKVHGPAIDDLFGEDADVIRRIIAITSQRQGVKGNVTAALHAYEQFKKDQPFKSYLSGVVKNLERFRYGLPPSGQKISEFEKVMAGEAEDAVAVDRHIARLLFNIERPSPQQTKIAQRAITDASKELAWSPAQTQAALWAYAKSNLTTREQWKSADTYAAALEAKADAIRKLRAELMGGTDAGSAGAGLPGRGEAGQTYSPETQNLPGQGQGLGRILSQASR